MTANEIASPATVLIVLGAATAVVSLPLLFGWIGPNRFYGIRVREAFSSEESWFRINVYGAKCFLVFAAAILLLGVALKLFPQAPFWLPIACLVFGLVLLLVTVAVITRYARSLKL